jgi:hypothetical protein
MRKRLSEWEEATKDQGRKPEPEAMYDSDMAIYLAGQKGKGGDVLRTNIALMKKWAREGK